MTIVESGTNQRCFPANLESPAEPATAAGTVLAQWVLCTRLPLLPCSCSLPGPTVLQERKWQTGFDSSTGKNELYIFPLNTSKSCQVGYSGSDFCDVSGSLRMVSICPESRTENTLAPLGLQQRLVSMVKRCKDNHSRLKTGELSRAAPPSPCPLQTAVPGLLCF